MRKFLALSFLVLLSSSYAKSDLTCAVNAQAGPEPAEYAVYAALLKETAIGKETTQLVTEERTEIAYQCDWLCGQGRYILLRKKDGEWKIEKEFGTWIS